MAIALSPTGSWLAATGTEGATAGWEVVSNELLFKCALDNWGESVEFDGSGYYLAQGADTPALACDAIRRWWYRLGKWRYDATSLILVLADCGGSNGYRVPLFRQQLHALSQRLGRTFRVCHLPPYCSKYSPIDHRLFCHLSRSLQAVQLTGIEVIQGAIRQTTTRTGLRVACELASGSYTRGVKADPDFLANEPTIRDNKLSPYNYKFSPY